MWTRPAPARCFSLCLFTLLALLAAGRAAAQSPGPGCQEITHANVSEISYWKDEWTARLPALKAEVARLKASIPKNKERAQKEIEDLREQRDRLKNANAKPAAGNGEDSTFADFLDDSINEKEEQIENFEENRQQLDVREAEVKDIEGKVVCAQTVLRTMSTPEQSFKWWMSITFGGLIALVIVGFFWQSYTDEAVRRAVFSGVTGIQLLTLFSIIIAVILFGITGILQDKELAALLGGLSGYILGRYNAPGGQQSPGPYRDGSDQPGGAGAPDNTQGAGPGDEQPVKQPAAP